MEEDEDDDKMSASSLPQCRPPKASDGPSMSRAAPLEQRNVQRVAASELHKGKRSPCTTTLKHPFPQRQREILHSTIHMSVANPREYTTNELRSQRLRQLEETSSSVIMTHRSLRRPSTPEMNHILVTPGTNVLQSETHHYTYSSVPRFSHERRVSRHRVQPD
ncbi:hypothetical protein EYF80_021242 [Liparis tanakae]|uniref:Uncharacterized protein n=1 Tax=Liparis tanakae TaxID=230148 RepID=A0A4Z2HRY0_9TELE|nr:hypothetical protein EYF80_021242 [Liparis tanakae]